MKATFIRFSEDKKCAVLMVKINPFSFERVPVYLPADEIPLDTKRGSLIEIPGGYKVVDFEVYDAETKTKVLRTYEDKETGELLPKKTLHWV